MKSVHLFYVLVLILHSTCVPFVAAQSSSPESTSQRIDQPSTWYLKVTPGVLLPISEDAGYFTFGGGAQVEGGYRFRLPPTFSVGGQVGYGLAPTTFATSLSILSVGARAEAAFPFGRRFLVSGFTAAGWYFSFLNSGAGPMSTNPYLQPGIGLRYLLSPSVDVGMECAYFNSLGLYNGIGIQATATISLGGRSAAVIQNAPEARPLKDGEEAPYLQVRDAAFEPVFPVFYTHYNDHPIGHATIRNNAKTRLQDISVSLFIKQYMDSPKACRAPTELAPGEQKPLELNALLTEKVLGVTQQTMVTAELTVSYRVGSEKHTDLYVETVRVNDRNALTWDDDRKAAAFVTERDPTVLKFSKNVASMVEGLENRQISGNLQTAMAIHLALGAYGMAYAVDPSTPYTEYSRNEDLVDFVQFPSQTLAFRAGDCDDLSVLYCALLLSRGVETAFITVPGHIFAAFSLDMKPSEARTRFQRADELIFTAENTWIPVEVTELRGGFLKAWQTGISEWREYDAKKVAALIPVREAWSLFGSTGFSGEQGDIVLPTGASVSSAFQRELDSFINREIYGKVAELTAEIGRQNNSPKAINGLAILYANYGLLDKAEHELRRIHEDPGYLPALVNLGNISYARKDMKKALEYYCRALAKDSSNPRVLLALARTSHAIENFADTAEFYGRLQAVDPELASRYTYLQQKSVDTSRAAAVERLKEEVLWEN